MLSGVGELMAALRVGPSREPTREPPREPPRGPKRSRADGDGDGDDGDRRGDGYGRGAEAMGTDSGSGSGEEEEEEEEAAAAAAAASAVPLPEFSDIPYPMLIPLFAQMMLGLGHNEQVKAAETAAAAAAAAAYLSAKIQALKPPAAEDKKLPLTAWGGEGSDHLSPGKFGDALLDWRPVEEYYDMTLEEASSASQPARRPRLAAALVCFAFSERLPACGRS